MFNSRDQATHGYTVYTLNDGAHQKENETMLRLHIIIVYCGATWEWDDCYTNLASVDFTYHCEFNCKEITDFRGKGVETKEK